MINLTLLNSEIPGNSIAQIMFLKTLDVGVRNDATDVSVNDVVLLSIKTGEKTTF